ncbi:MAG: yjoB, partial [Burkholderiaceae bacterium]|nr:yjoB [Burkholderiaceae bacterium]
PTVTDEKIGNLLSSVPQRSVILIEDVDAFFRQRDKADTGVKVSYSGFINALDGVAAHEGSVVFLTTNHPELIDEAAIRSGRVDFRLELGLCDASQLERMFLRRPCGGGAVCPRGGPGPLVAGAGAGAVAEGGECRRGDRAVSGPADSTHGSPACGMMPPRSMTASSVLSAGAAR